MPLDIFLDFFLDFNWKAFISIIFIDLVLSGDNALIIGMAASGLPPELRKKAIIYGTIVATVMRIGFSAITYQLLDILGLTLAGGILLLWVAYRLWQDIRSSKSTQADGHKQGTNAATQKTFFSAMMSIVIADVTMSLDNVLAVAGAAHGAPAMLVFGLILSIILMAFAANHIAKLLEKHSWIAYVGLVIIAYVAGDMIFRGSSEVYSFIALL